MEPKEPMVPTGDLATYVDGTDDRALLDRATAIVRDHCGWHVSPPIEETFTVWPLGGLLYLRSLWITEVVSVLDVDGNTLQASVYENTGGGAIRVTGGYAYRGPYTVTVTHGFESAPAVEAEILKLAARMKTNPTAPHYWRAGAYGEGSTGDNPWGLDEQVLAPYTLKDL